MKSAVILTAAMAFFSTTAMANCQAVAKNMNPYKGLVTPITNVVVKWETDKEVPSMTGWKYQWKYRFAQDRPTLSSWSVMEKGKKRQISSKMVTYFFSKRYGVVH